MNEKNFEYLSDQIKYTGFGEEHAEKLRENILSQAPNFSLEHQNQYGTDKVTATLNFRKSDQSDMYFFNSYKVQLEKENAKTMEQTFYINKGSNITMKEAYNLMEGRAVNKDLLTKEGEAYNAWVQLDFKETDANGNFKMNHFHQNYGYDLEQALDKHPIKELLQPDQKVDLLNSLEKGNRQAVQIIKDGQEVRHYIEANPQFKSVNLYDSNQQRLNARQPQEQSQQTSQSNSTQRKEKNEQKVGSESDDSGSQKKKTRTRKAL